jgi:hypothetical protein
MPRRTCHKHHSSFGVLQTHYREHTSYFGKALAIHCSFTSLHRLVVRAISYMVHLLAWLGRLSCFTRTGIDRTHKLPRQSSPRPHTPKHGSRSLTAQQPQRPLPPTDGTEDLDSSSMPPKRKNADTSATMDRPEKKTKTTKKGRKAAPAEEEEGKSIFLSPFITSAFGVRVLVVRCEVARDAR